MTSAAFVDADVKGRILCLEDDEKDFVTYVAKLRGLGWSVTWAKDPDEAALHLQNPDYDVIISDRLWEDGVGGRPALGDDHVRELSFRTGFAAVIVLTHHPERQAIMSAIRYGVHEVVVKGEHPGETKFITYLDKVCTRALGAQLVRRVRQSLLRLSPEDVLKELGVLLSDVLNPAATPDQFYVQYVEVFHGETARVRPLAAGAPGGRAGDRFVQVDQLPGLRSVVETAQPVLESSPHPLPSGQGLGSRVRTRVLMPVLQMQSPNSIRRALVGALWLEFADGAPERLDLLFIRDVADCLSDVLSINRDRERYGAEQRLLEQAVLMADVATRISSPLQAAQSRVDLLRARLGRDEGIPAAEILDVVTGVGDLLERAVQEAGAFRDAASRRFRRTTDLRLDRLAQDATAYLLHAEGRRVTLDTPDPAVVRADQDEVRAAVHALLRSTSAHPGGGRVEVQVDPTGRNTVMIRAAHPAADPDARCHLFDRTPATARDPRALWPLAEFARSAEGELRAVPAADGTTWVELVLRAAPVGEGCT